MPKKIASSPQDTAPMIKEPSSLSPVDRLLEPTAYPELARWLKEKKSVLFDRQWSASSALHIAQIQALGYGVACISADSERQSRLMSELELFCPAAPRLCLPSFETLPCEPIAPSFDIVGLRMAQLWQLAEKKQKNPIVLLTTQALQQRTLKPKRLKEQALEIKKGLSISQSSFIAKLLELGYSEQEKVMEKGHFARRMGLVDIYLPHELEPLRIEWWGDEIDSLRLFDLQSQRSLAPCDSRWLLPADELKDVDPNAGVLNYLDKPFVILFDQIQLIEDRYVEIDSMPGSIHRGYVPFHRALEGFEGPKVYMSHLSIDALCEPIVKKGHRDILVTFEVFGKSQEAIYAPLTQMRLQERFVSSEGESDFFKSIDLALEEGYEVALLHASEAEQSTARSLLSPKALNHPHLSWVQGYLSESIVVDSLKVMLAPMAQYNHHHRLYRPKLRISHTPVDLDLLELTAGEAVVHLHHGIGLFRGIERKSDLQGQSKEYLNIEYAGKSNLYVPIENAHLVVRYESPDETSIELHTIAGTRWKKQYQQASDSIQGYAKQLLELYATRLLQKSIPCPLEDSSLVQQFEDDFPYEMTEDQVQSIEAIKKDLSLATPMDRLICGDVGYGKTEVAMRSAFKMVADCKAQVAVLCPTTVLTLQHYETFANRMSGFGVQVASISRFTKAAEKRRILEQVAQGRIDILIGTHRLLSGDVQFQRLGLLIIDEEQRFGVKAKEHLKCIKKDVNCLTLSATPIPRTLHLSLMGGKQLSTIATPPHDRQPITTLICERRDEVIRSALQRELGRGGQAFYVRNDIHALPAICAQMQKLLPQLRVALVHGQMAPDEIEEIFHQFKNHKIDLLVTTTIIETGIDIPNANTLFIDPCDEFGLSDLYQLRGRVGRWNRKAYAYLIYPPKKTLSAIAKKRLEAIAAASGYGSGMKLALRDLSIRGCGELIGQQQSGHLSSIGFSLYCRLLQRAMERLAGKVLIDVERVRLDHNLPAIIPESYIHSLSLRLEIYQRAAQISQKEQLDQLQEEMLDRYGKAPQAIQWLFVLSRLRLECAIASVDWMKLHYCEKAPSLEIQFEKQLGAARSQRVHCKVRVENTPSSVLETVLSYLYPSKSPSTPQGAATAIRIKKPKIDIGKFKGLFSKDPAGD